MSQSPEERRIYNKVYQKAYHTAHKEQSIDYRKTYYAIHKEQIKIYNKIYHATHKKENNARNRIYYVLHRKELMNYRKAYYACHRERYAAYQKAYYIAHPEKYRAKKILNKFGLSLEKFNIIFNNQDGVCAICGNADWNGRAPYIDHDHLTGKVRGLICRNCNLALGAIRDNSETARAMASYLEYYRNNTRQKPFIGMAPI